MTYKHTISLTICILITSCRQSEKPPRQVAHITVPAASVDRPYQAPDLPQKAALLEHPWIKRQPDIDWISPAIAYDIESLQSAYEQLTELRVRAGHALTSLEQDTAQIMSAIESLQAPLETLKLAFPTDKYSVLNIPEARSDLYPSPLPFQIHKRVYWGDADTGIPLYLDVRVFDLPSGGDSNLTRELIDWHLGALEGGVNHFEHYIAGDCEAWIGHGDLNSSRLDPSHGFGNKDRGLFLGCLQQANRLYILHLNAPWASFEKSKLELLSILNRSLERIPQR